MFHHNMHYLAFPDQTGRGLAGCWQLFATKREVRGWEGEVGRDINRSGRKLAKKLLPHQLTPNVNAKSSKAFPEPSFKE